MPAFRTIDRCVHAMRQTRSQSFSLHQLGQRLWGRDWFDADYSPDGRDLMYTPTKIPQYKSAHHSSLILHPNTPSVTIVHLYTPPHAFINLHTASSSFMHLLYVFIYLHALSCTFIHLQKIHLHPPSSTLIFNHLNLPSWTLICP